MPQLLKKRRISNPSRVSRRRRNSSGKKRMTAKQIKFFGTKAQRAALKRRRTSNPSKRRTIKTLRTVARKHPVAKRQVQQAVSAIRKNLRRKKRQSNIGEIITLLPGNPGTLKGKSKMAKSRKRRKNYGTKVGRSWSAYSSRKRRKNPGARRRHRRHNPATRIVYRTRRHNVARRRRGGARRNPGMFSGTFGKVFGVLGGAAATKVIVDRLPASLQGGVVGYLSTAAIALLQGKLIGKVFKSPALGSDMTIGGFTYLGIKLLNDFMPSLGLPFGLSGGRGMGLLTPSSFYVPQVNQAGSMAQFIAPAGLPVPVATGMKGLGATSMSQRRMGRTA